jgi:GGDEF domain-containing protein
LEQEFPQMPVGEEFESLFESCANKNDRFAVFVICLDDFERMLKDFGEDITSGTLIRLARIIAAVSKAHSMQWGRLDQERFACLCPNVNEQAAVDFATEIQRQLALAGTQTVSIGVAVHPFWPFEKTSVLANAFWGKHHHPI